MIDDAAELDFALFDTMLEGRAARSVELPDSAGSVLFVNCDGGEIFEAWAAARSVLDTTGRWPVALCAFGDEVDAGVARRSRLAFGDASAQQILDDITRSSNAASISSFTDRLHSSDVFAPRYSESLSFLRHSLDSLEYSAGSSPTEDEVRSALGPSATDPQLERFLHDWEMANGLAPKTTSGHMGWFVPEPDDDPSAIAFLPTPRDFETVAHFGFYGANGRQAALGGVLRSWNERFGAELVANHGTMLQFVVERPPTNIDTAFELACEHAGVAECTLALPGISLREHASSLIGLDIWLLHERP